MEETKENQKKEGPEFSSNIFGWKWSYFSLGIILVSAFIFFVIGPGDAGSQQEYDIITKDSTTVIQSED